MVFKGRFFSSRKSDQSGSPSGSNTDSPRSPATPTRSDKKKSKNDLTQIGSGSKSGSSGSKLSSKDGVRSKQGKGKEKEKVKGEALSPAQTKVREVPPSVSPILASSLGLNKIKTRSGPLPQESFFGFRGEKGMGLGSSNLSKQDDGWKKKEVGGKSRMGLLQSEGAECGSNSRSMLPENSKSKDQSLNAVGQSRLQNEEATNDAGQLDSSTGPFGGLRSADVCTPEESESPRFQAIMRVTSAPRKRFPNDIKSFSHELNSKGVRPFPFWKPRGLNNLQEILVGIRSKFDKAKEEVNSDLAVFAADLVGILEKNAESHPEWQETIEDLLILARSCAMTPPGEFWLQCEGIVQELDDKRQELPMGIQKQLHTRMLFILTRCTRLLQFHKESGLAEDEHV